MSGVNEGKSIDKLPWDVLQYFAIKIGSESLTDITALKLCSKDLLATVGSEYVHKTVSLEKIEIDPWIPHPPHIKRALQKCKDAENPDYYFMEGLKLYFIGKQTKICGIKYLGKAARDGHKEAKYFLCMLGLSVGGSAHYYALQVLNNLQKQHPNWNVDTSRNKIQVRLTSLWVFDMIFAKPFENKCPKVLHTTRRLREMEFKDDPEIESCDHCRWYREFMSFCKMVNIYV